MPFTKGSTPRRLQGKGIPQKFVDIFIEVFNSVYKKNKDDGAAYRQGYAVMGQNLRKAGYRQQKDGSWKKTRADKEDYIEVPVVGSKPEIMGRTVLTESGQPKTLEDYFREGMGLRGVALVDDSISQQGTGQERYYSKEFNDRCLENSLGYMEDGHRITVYNRHSSASEGGFFSSGSTENPIGKAPVIERDGSKIMYEMFISPTEAGREVMQLLWDDVMGETSVRIYEWEMRPEQLQDPDEKDLGTLNVMTNGHIGGIDFCDQGGIVGAGVQRILESAPTWNHSEEEQEMEIGELTYEELLEARRDLLDRHVAETVGLLLEDNRQLKEALDKAQETPSEALTQENEQLKSGLEAATAQLARAQESASVYELVATPIVREMATKMSALPAEERAGQLEAIRDAAITAQVAELQTVGKGQVIPKAEPMPTIPEGVEDIDKLMANTR